eukprot:TRINITY_DN5891_c0_g1_i6.p1 TRINITY_DN5891_c0_g1~~TRINITY_DN5891_c0_g1_i6.p1  ORF type:complete len:1333 (+),score=183.74 TRINITY_DN5891_c0_g1_i6:56-4054(+)
MDCEGWSLRPTPAGASLRKHHVISASLRSQREASRGRSRRLFAPKAARSTLPDQSEGVGSESNCGVAASVITRCRPGVELNDCEDDSFSARFPLVSPLNSHAATSSTRPISRSTSPDLGPRRATFACFQSQYAALAPSQRERSREDKCTNRSPSSSAEPRLDGYRPSFKVDWLCALRDELLCGVKQEAMVLREDFSRAVEDILNAVEFQMLSGVTQMQGTVCKTLEMDAQRAAFVSSDQLAMSSILERIGSMEADMRSLLERTGNVPPTAGIEASISSVIERLDSMKMEMGPVAVKLTNELSRVVDKSAHKERVAREKTIDITTKALDELKRARDDVDILKDLMSKLERRPHVDVSSIVAAIKPLVVSPAVDLKPMMVPIFQAVEEGVRPLSTMLSRLDARSQVDTDARSQVDSTQVLGVLADIKAMLSTISESTIESEAKLASVMDYSAIEKQLSDLGGVCAASHEKLSNIDTDLFRTELSALKRLSETSSEALGALVAQTDTRLPRPAESSNEAKAQIDLTPVLSALADQKIAISKLDDMASASESKLASMDYSVLEKKLNDVITACEARPQAERTSGLDARADQGLATPKANDAAVASQTRCALLDYSSMEHKLDGVLEACRRLQSHADFTPVLTALEQQTVAISNIEDVVTATKSLLASTDCSSLEGKIDTLVGVCGISQSQVDLSPVLTALAEQKASILSVNEVAVASEHRLASMDMSGLEKRLNDLTRICEASHEKVSSLDADMMFKELSALKCLSEASSDFLKSIVAQIEALLSRPARSDAESAIGAPALSQVDLSPVLTALAEQKAAISKIDEIATASRSRLESADYFVSGKQLNDAASADTRSQVDLAPVMSALAEQMAAIANLNEVCTAADTKLASIDYCDIGRKIDSLVSQSADLLDKLSTLDSDLLCKELAAFKSSSELSFQSLDAAVAQIGARLLQSPESGTKASCERQVHDEPVDSARYIDVIKETSEATMVAIEKANESIVHSLTLRTREIMQATSLSTSTVTASLKGLTATAGEILDQCCRPRTDADFISVLEAIKGLEEHTSSRLCATSEATLQAINNKMDRDDLRLVLEANSDTRAQLTQLLESVLDAARATDTTAKAVASQQAVASDAALKAIGDLASRPAVDLSPVLDALRAPNAQLDCSVSIKRNSDDAPDVRPDIDFGSLSDELRLGAERSSKLLVAFSDTAQKHTTDVDRMLSELAQCTAGLEACTEDAEGKEGASKALEAWTRSEQELMKVVHDVKADALQRLAGSISSGFLNSITAIADLSKVLSEVHDLVGDDATAAELRKGVEPLLDGVGYLRAKSSAFSPALEG